MTNSKLGLPDVIRACLFDLDGVITETARLHARAWKQTFDQFLSHAGQSAKKAYVPFKIAHDYELYVDGKPRDDGTRSFLASRGIRLPEGADDDPVTADTIKGLGKRKNELLLTLLREDGVEAYPGSVQYVRAVKQAGMRIAVVSSSTNCRDVLLAAGIAELFDVRIDGVVAAEQRLAGKPSPDTYLAAAQALSVPAIEAAVFEDALAGVEAGRTGKFGFVVGVDRIGQADALRRHGADIVVADLLDMLQEAE
jgi:beta-phosphoglucomutase family hydrolase